MNKRYRTPESVKKRIDLMLQKGTITLDHGCGSYQFDHYDYYEPSYTNNYESKLVVYYLDYDSKKPKEYMTLTADNLRQPKTESDYFLWFVDCYWEKDYPTLLCMREYEYRPIHRGCFIL